MGKLIRLGATALSMIGILVMILCVQAAILFVRLCIRRKQKKIVRPEETEKCAQNCRKKNGDSARVFSVSNPIAFPPGKRYNKKQAKKW